MGIPGLILAPVVLNYLRVEMLTVEVPALARSAAVEPLAAPVAAARPRATPLPSENS